jgi:hypothetical protein
VTETPHSWRTTAPYPLTTALWVTAVGSHHHAPRYHLTMYPILTRVRNTSSQFEKDNSHFLIDYQTPNNELFMITLHQLHLWAGLIMCWMSTPARLSLRYKQMTSPQQQLSPTPIATVSHQNRVRDILLNHVTLLSLWPITLIDMIISYYRSSSSRLLLFGSFYSERTAWASTRGVARAIQTDECIWSIDTDDLCRYYYEQQQHSTSSPAATGTNIAAALATPMTNVECTWTAHYRWPFQSRSRKPSYLMIPPKSTNNTSTGTVSSEIKKSNGYTRDNSYSHGLGKLLRFGDHHSLTSEGACAVDEWHIITPILSSVNATSGPASTPLSSPSASTTVLQSMPTPRKSHFIQLTLPQRSHEILAIAGMNHVTDETLSHVECYNTITNTWTREDALLPRPCDESKIAIDTHTHRVYVFSGGKDNAIQLYDPVSCLWTLVVPANTPKHRLGAIVLYVPVWRGIVIVGGDSWDKNEGQLMPVLSIDFYHPTSNSYIAVPTSRWSMPTGYRVYPLSLCLIHNNNNNGGHGTMLVMFNKSSINNIPEPIAVATGSRLTRKPAPIPDIERQTGFMCDLSAFATIDDLINGTTSSTSASLTSSSGPPIGSTLPVPWIPLPALKGEPKKKGNYRFTDCFLG